MKVLPQLLEDILNLVWVIIIFCFILYALFCAIVIVIIGASQIYPLLRRAFRRKRSYSDGWIRWQKEMRDAYERDTGLKLDPDDPEWTSQKIYQHWLNHYL